MTLGRRAPGFASSGSGRRGYLPRDLRPPVTIFEEHEGEIERALGKLSKHVPFAEAFAEGAVGEAIRVDTRSTAVTPAPRLSGVVFRVWTGRLWAEAGSSSFAAKELDATVERLQAEASRAGGTAAPPGESMTTQGTWVTHPKRSPRDLGTEGVIALAKDARGWASAVPGIVEVQARVQWEEEQRLYCNSAGARCRQTTMRSHAVVIPIALENGRAEFDYWNSGGVGGLEAVADFDEESVREAALGSKALLQATAPPAGETTVVLDASVAGLFAHESFGHGTEADQFVRDRSYLKPLVGQTVGPEFLSIVDDGTFPGGWGTIFCDDEGHPAQKTALVDHGRFIGALHDRETASVLHARPTASTRRSNFQCRPFVRMTNTYVAPGKHTVEELIAEVNDGVLLERGTSGIEDPLGGQMQLKVKRGHLIQHGKVTELVRSMALSGKVLDFLRSIRGVSRDPLTSIQPGFCGKGHSDYIPVGTGGVHLLARAIVGPA